MEYLEVHVCYRTCKVAKFIFIEFDTKLLREFI